MTTALGQKISAKLKELGTNPYRLATEKGLKPDRFRKIIEGNSKDPKLSSLEEIASALGWTLEELLAGTEHAGKLMPIAPTTTRSRKPGAAPVNPDADLPLLGLARAGYGGKGMVFDSQKPIAYIARPPQLRGVVGAYAGTTHGDSMKPRFNHGEMFYVDPSDPVRPGDDVVVLQAKGPQGFLKILVEIGPEKIRCEQYNPPGKVDFKADTVIAVHKIILHAPSGRR